MKKHYFQFLLFVVTTMVISSCQVQHDVVYGDAIRFSDDAITSYSHADGKFKNLKSQSEPFLLLDTKGANKEGMNQMSEFLHRVDSGNATAGYYALDLALDRVKYVRKHQFKHDPNTRYFIVYLTDGLDNVSVRVAKNHKQLWFINSEDRYAKRIQRKMKKVMGVFKIKQNAFQVYPIMYLGDDMARIMKDRGAKTLADQKKEAAEAMEYYRGASKGTEVPEVLVETDFKKVAKDFEDALGSTGFQFQIPVGYRNQRVRMNLKNAKGEKVQIEGTFKRSFFKWRLKDITYTDGASIPDQRPLFRNKPLTKLTASAGDRKALFAVFRMDQIKLNGKNFKVAGTPTQEHMRNGKFEINTEYKKSNFSDIYVLLVMDESGSVGSKLKSEQKAMEEILNVIMHKSN